MAVYAGILVVVMLMIKLIPLVTLGDTWAQVYTHRPLTGCFSPFTLTTTAVSNICLPTYLPPTYDYLDACTGRQLQGLPLQRVVRRHLRRRRRLPRGRRPLPLLVRQGVLVP